MRKRILIILVLGCLFSAGYVVLTTHFEGAMVVAEFNEALAPEQAKALDAGIALFDRFLDDNFPNRSSEGAQMRAFLTYLQKHNTPNDSWTYNAAQCAAVFAQLEESGMRRAIRAYGYEPDDTPVDTAGTLTLDMEEEELPPIAGMDSADMAARHARRDSIEQAQQLRWDSMLHFSSYGKYAMAVEAVQHHNPKYAEYLGSVRLTNGTIPTMAVEGALSGYTEEELADPIVKRILFAEVFWYLLHAQVNEAR